MDTAPQQQSILETLRTVEFRLGLKGYNVDEVDEYLEKTAVEAESLLAQVRSANERLAAANGRIVELELEVQTGSAARPAAPAEPLPGGAPVGDDSLARTLLLAQRFVDQAKRESEEEATQVVQRAEERARLLVSQAEERARQIAGEAEQRLREEVGRLEGMRTRLTADVEAVGRRLEEERSRIRASLTEALKWFEELRPADAVAQGRGGVDDAGPDAPAGARPGAPERPAPAPAAAPSQGRAAPGPGARVSPEPVQAAAGARLRSVPGGAPVEELFQSVRRPE